MDTILYGPVNCPEILQDRADYKCSNRQTNKQTGPYCHEDTADEKSEVKNQIKLINSHLFT